MMDYKGYKLLDTIMLVCRHDTEDGVYQAYLADPKNKSQLKSARDWAKVTVYGRYDRKTGTYPDKVTYDPVEFTFDNNGFTFELLEYAKGSSQGGKLSFWNCLVKKDGNTFKIGINSELLLGILRESDFEKGKCKQTVRFASRNSKVGVVAEGSESLNAALNDMMTKDKLSKSMTTRYKPGDNVTTLTIDDIYLGEAYYQYELCDTRDRYYCNTDYSKDFVLYKHKNPVKVHLFASRNYKSMKCFSDIFKHQGRLWWTIDVDKTKKKRAIGNNPAKIDMTPEEMNNAIQDGCSNVEKISCVSTYEGERQEIRTLRYMQNKLFGVYMEVDKPYVIAQEFLDAINSLGIKIKEID